MKVIRTLMCGFFALAAGACLPAQAQVGGGIDDELPQYGEPTRYIYSDGINQLGEVRDDFGMAVIDASTKQVSVYSGGAAYLVSFDELMDHASAGSAARRSIIGTEIDYVFRQGGVSLADGASGIPKPYDPPSLTDYRDFCGALQCGNNMADWLSDWSFKQKPPVVPPPQPPQPPPPSEQCAEAFAEVVEARLAIDTAETTCKTAGGSRGKQVACAAMIVYGSVRTSLASRRAANCVAPPPPPPPPGSGYYGWVLL